MFVNLTWMPTQEDSQGLRNRALADAKPNFPQIPSTLWWGIREQFKKTVPAKVTDSYLVAQLNVQATAAQQYLRELKRVGLLDNDGKPTEAAKKWRFDDTYREAADSILRTAYPGELIEIAPPTDHDRAKAVRWFMQAGDLGEGAAKNKASTYFMIGSNDPPSDISSPKATKAPTKRSAPQRETASKGQAPAKRSEPSPPAPPESFSGSADAMPLNVNVQIHISADASSEQIESIFANMKKYLR